MSWICLIDGLFEQEGPVFKEAQTRIISRNTAVVKDNKEVPIGKNSLERWKATGVIALAECNLKVWKLILVLRISQKIHGSRLQSQIKTYSSEHIVSHCWFFAFCSIVLQCTPIV